MLAAASFIAIVLHLVAFVVSLARKRSVDFGLKSSAIITLALFALIISSDFRGIDGGYGLIDVIPAATVRVTSHGESSSESMRAGSDSTVGGSPFDGGCATELMAQSRYASLEVFIDHLTAH